MQSLTLVGAHIQVFINGKLYAPVQSVNYSIDTADQELYGVDSIYPQEIVPIKSMVTGSISGLKLKNAGGLQASGIRHLAKDILSYPYITIRITDRSSGEDILFIQKARVTTENFTASTKTSVKFSFQFRGIIPLQPLDRA